MNAALISKNSDLAELKLACYQDPVLYCKTFLPHWFPENIPWVHRGMLATMTNQVDFLWKYGDLQKIITNFWWLEDPEDLQSAHIPIFEIGRDGRLLMRQRRFNSWMLPRGGGKTTLINAVQLRDVNYLDAMFTVYISEATQHAKLQLGSIAAELETNQDLINAFGEHKPDRQSRLKWTEDHIETTTGAAIIARGRGGQVRGLLHKGERPTKIHCDDIEDEESVLTPEQRQKSRRFLYSSVIPALSRDESKNPRLFMTGTLLHSDALLARVQKDKQFGCIRFGATDVDGAYWWSKLDEKFLSKMKDSFVVAGEEPKYWLEYHNTLRGVDGQFNEEMFIYHNPAGWENFIKAIAMDPAIGEKRGADYACIAVVGKDMRTGQDWVLDIWMKHAATPRELIDQFFAMGMGWRCTLWGIESVAYQAALLHLAKEEMFRRTHFFEVEGIQHAKNRKHERIRGALYPRYFNKHVVHAKRFPLYEQQLLDFPLGHDDGPDTVAMAEGLLEPFVGGSAPQEANPARDIYRPLDDEIGDWRICP